MTSKMLSNLFAAQCQIMPSFMALEGTLYMLELNSTALIDNRIGEKTRRKICVYTPPHYDEYQQKKPVDRLPLLVYLAAYTGSGLQGANWKGFDENLIQRLDRLICKKKIPHALIAFPDCFTKLGGNQYVNSPVLGKWQDFLADELVAVLEDLFFCGGPGKRAVFGKSSGGFGALHQLITRPDIWSAAACHAGDMGFDWCYLPDFPKVLRILARYEGDIKTFLENFWQQEKKSGEEFYALMHLTLAASYDPDPEAPYGISLPVDMYDCRLDDKKWQRWLAYDPVLTVQKHRESLQSCKGIYIDCGLSDQYNLLYGARQCHHHLKALGIEHDYEEFTGTHSGIDHRYEVSLPRIIRKL